MQKYPNSRYRSPVYGTLVMAYVQAGQVQKMEETADKEIALNPNDVQVLAVVAQTLPRAMNSKTPNPDKVLVKAEESARKAIELTPTLPKPAAVTDESFSTVKNQTLGMAHGGLGLVYIRRGKFSEAIPELNQSVTMTPLRTRLTITCSGWPMRKLRISMMPPLPIINAPRPLVPCRKHAKRARRKPRNLEPPNLAPQSNATRIAALCLR